MIIADATRQLFPLDRLVVAMRDQLELLTSDKQGGVNQGRLAEFLTRNGQLLLAMVELIEHRRMAVDNLIDVLGRASIEAVLGLSARHVAGAPQQGKARAGIHRLARSSARPSVPEGTQAPAPQAREGAYLLRTNLPATDVQSLRLSSSIFAAVLKCLHPLDFIGRGGRT